MGESGRRHSGASKAAKKAIGSGIPLNKKVRKKFRKEVTKIQRRNRGNK